MTFYSKKIEGIFSALEKDVTIFVTKLQNFTIFNKKQTS